MKQPGDLKQFFKNIATQLQLDFQYGNSQRILNRQSSDLTYPVLWLEKPNMGRAQNGGAKAIFRAAFVVLIDTQGDEVWDTVDEKQDLAWEITEKILNRLDKEDDNTPPAFEFDRAKCSSECLEYFTGDADTGWRTSFSITSTFCITDDFWDSEAWMGAGEFFGAGGDDDVMGSS